MKKERLDVLLVNKGLAPSREKAKALIMAGVVFVNESREEKPGTQIICDANIEVKEKMPYVSRGGYKLEKAINEFDICIKGKKALDIGASTGGFRLFIKNDVLGIVAIDVGYGQLA